MVNLSQLKAITQGFVGGEKAFWHWILLIELEHLLKEISLTRQSVGLRDLTALPLVFNAWLNQDEPPTLFHSQANEEDKALFLECKFGWFKSNSFFFPPGIGS